MKKFVYGVLAAATLSAALSVAPAQARPVSFAITLGDVQFAYVDGYYDSHRRWHTWRNAEQRKWYQQHHRGSYLGVSHSRDNDHNRRDWRNGKRHDWH